MCACGNHPAAAGFLYVRLVDGGRDGREVEYVTGVSERELYLWCPECLLLLDVGAYDHTAHTYPVAGRLEHVQTLA